MLVALALSLLEVLMNQPPAAPPAPLVPAIPPQLAASTLEAVRAELERRGVCGPSVRVLATEYTLGARRIVDAFATDAEAVPFPLRARRVWVLDGTAPLDLIISGEPMSRRQLRALLDDKQHPVGLFEVAKLVTNTDGALASVGSAHSGDPQGFPKEIAERVRPPAVTGPPGQRRFSFDTLANLKTPHSRVTVEVDGEGGLNLQGEPLLPALTPPPGLGTPPPLNVVLPPLAPLPAGAEPDAEDPVRPQFPVPPKPSSK